MRRRLPVAGWLALATALIFVLHPVQTEAVTYASGRSTSLSALFALGSVAAWVTGGGRRPGPARLLLLPLSLLLMLAGIATKETMAVVPAVLLLWEAADVSRPFSWRAGAGRTGWHWLLLGCALGVALSLPAYRDFLASSLATRSVAENLVAQLQGIRYLAGQLLNIDRMNADPALAATPGPRIRGRADAGRHPGRRSGLALTRLRRFPLPAFARPLVPALAGADQLAARAPGSRQRSSALRGAGGPGAAAGGRHPPAGNPGSRGSRWSPSSRCWPDRPRHPPAQRRLPGRGDVLAGRREPLAAQRAGLQQPGDRAGRTSATCAGPRQAWQRALALDPGYVAGGGESPAAAGRGAAARASGPAATRRSAFRRDRE